LFFGHIKIRRIFLCLFLKKGVYCKIGSFIFARSSSKSSIIINQQEEQEEEEEEQERAAPGDSSLA